MNGLQCQCNPFIGWIYSECVILIVHVNSADTVLYMMFLLLGMSFSKDCGDRYLLQIEVVCTHQAGSREPVSDEKQYIIW